MYLYSLVNILVLTIDCVIAFHCLLFNTLPLKCDIETTDIGYYYLFSHLLA